MTSVDRVAGVTLPGVEILEELGRGARTIVYRGRREGHDYAVKLGRSVSDDDAAGAVFRREASVLAAIRHPALPTIFEVGEVDGRPYLVMELLTGTTLADLLSEGPLDVDVLVRVASDVAAGLAEAHRRAVVHRDVKPDNIIVTASGHAKLIDFGLAGKAGASSGDQVVGTMLYNPPEQTGMLNRPVDARSDLYSLGAVMFECATGQRPFPATDVGELARLHAVGAVTPVLELRPEAPPALAGMIEKLLAKDPDDRYQTAEGLAADLGRVATGETDFVLASEDHRAVEVKTPFVGRDRELKVLRTAWDDARAGRLRVLELVGQAGAGKTRLVEEFVSDIDLDRGRGLVLAGACSPDAAVPLEPIRKAFLGHLDAIDRLEEDDAAAARATLRAAAGEHAATVASLTPRLAAALGVDAQTSDSEEQFQLAMIPFLNRLASDSGGAVLWLDNAQFADDATARLLRRVIATDAPLLVVLSHRGGDDDVGGDQRAMISAPNADVLELGPLDRRAVAALVSEMLDSTVDDAFVRAITVRSGGNPWTVTEYLRAVIDAGLLRPNWGRCTVDHGALDSLALSDNVVDLVLGRIDQLGEHHRPILLTAALSGPHFDDVDVAAAAGVTDAAVTEAIAAAQKAELVERTSQGWAFVHERVRLALAANASDDEVRRIHQRLADVMDTGDLTDPSHLYTTARHYLHGEPDHNPHRRLLLVLQAARQAMQDHAPIEAVTYLTNAAATAEQLNQPLDPETEALYGEALIRAGQPREGEERLHAALDRETDPWRRARLYGQLSRLAHSRAGWERAAAHAEEGLAAVGLRMPKNAVALAITLVARLLRALGSLRRGSFGAATGEEREHHEIQILLHRFADESLYMSGARGRAFVHAMSTLHPSNRLGVSPAYILGRAKVTLKMASLGRRRFVHRMLPKLMDLAAEQGDPILVAEVVRTAGIAHELLGEPVEAADDLYRAMRELEPWDKGSHYRAIATSLFWNLRLRGQLGESWRLIERLHGGSGRSPGLSIMRDYLAWWLGYPARGESEISEDLRRIERWPASDRGKVFEMLVALRVCKGDVGADTEELLARSKEGALSTRRLGLWDRMGVLTEAELRIEQWRQAPDERRREARRRARGALRRLRRHARRAPLLQAHLAVLEAAALQLAGRPRRTLRRSEAAVRLARSIDAPVVRFRAMQQAAQALQATGQRHAAQGEAKLAMSLASQHGWVGPARQMREEFRLDRTSLSTPSAGGSSPHLRSSESSGTGSSSVGHRDSRHLDALLRVTAASANVLDPRRLARVALDQMLGILGAERAYLFVVDDHDEALEMFAGRDAQGKDITDMTGYSTTVVERCRAEQEAFIVTGTEEGAAMGSESAVHHGLRSMLAAPLQLDGKLLGVIYLDSRLAKGVFTQEDVDILVAIAKQVAVSLTTARSAQLESMVTAERQQRVLAEALRDVMTEAAATLDPVEVLSRTLATAQRAVNYDAACVLVSQADGAARVAAARGAVDADAIDTTVSAHGVLAQVIAGQALTDRDTSEIPPLPGAQLQPKSWLAVPIALGDTVAAVVMGSATEGAYGPSQVEIASTLVSQVAVAYQNASMFTEIERLAVTDELSGLANRRSFFEQAIREFEEAKRLGRDLSAVMLDIDHFKPINDTLGHAVGDEVIRHVGKRLAELARGDDIVGRYGGEEFALIITAGRGPAMRLAERLRSAVEEEVIPAGDSTVKITVSVGVAVLSPQDHTLEDLLVRADAALYEAKQAGRNLVIAA